MVRLLREICGRLMTAAHFYIALCEIDGDAQVFSSTPSEPDSSIVQRPVK